MRFSICLQILRWWFFGHGHSTSNPGGPGFDLDL